MANFGERYQLVERLGSGGMGEVWLARDEELAGRPVAIKIMQRHLLPNEADVTRFEREMRFAAMMNHPNIVTVYTTGTYDHAPFMVMEYLRGRDLEKAPPVGDARPVAAIGRDICSALAYAHSQGVLHRDIKPSNLFLCESGQVKVTDFGIARAVGETTRSTTGILVGTLAYLPPERWRGEPPDFSNDIWAAGCVLYRLICGRLPRVLPEAPDYAAAALRADPVADLRDITDAPAWLTSPVMAMLAVDPASRPTAAECAQLLAGPQVPEPARGPRGRGGVRLLPGRPGASAAETGPVIGAAPRDPVTVPVRRPASAPASGSRSRRPDRVVLLAAGAVLLLLSASVTAWRLSASPRAAELSVHTITLPASASPGAGRKTASAPAFRPSAAATSPPPSASPASSGSGFPAASPSPSPASSRSASPARTPAASPAVSRPASRTPPAVPVPDVTGLTFTQARVLLLSDGFQVVGLHTRLGQIVTRTSPAGQAPAGSVIYVVYGQGV